LSGAEGTIEEGLAADTPSFGLMDIVNSLTIQDILLDEIVPSSLYHTQPG
jgi:hypothetical protein